jgi:hypothetical protein
MAQNYYDEFVKLPLDKMAQKMEDMTFLYHETRVPKKHYKEKLSVAVEEMIESGVEMNLIATYYRTLEELKKQNGFSKPYYAWKQASNQAQSNLLNTKL